MVVLGIALIAAGVVPSIKAFHAQEIMPTMGSRELKSELVLKLKNIAVKKAALTSEEELTTYSYR
jgi:hypothetical protein